MNILIIGSGGREHALAWKIAQSPSCNNLFIAPGNPGTAQTGKNLDWSGDFNQLKSLVLSHNINLVVVGPEAPLVEGIKDFFEQDEALQKVILTGPSQAASQLEGSKNFAKDFMKKHGIPTAESRTFTQANLSEGKEFLKTKKPPFVLKADGLASGKGVMITESREEAENILEEMLIREKFGEASQQVVIEEYLDGKECSAFILADGENYIFLPGAKDYKRIGEGDTGLNTGGMGAVSPVPFMDKTFEEKIRTRIIEPTLKGMQQEGTPYQGFLFLGLMKVGNDPYVIEYNVRLGDPEAEAILPRFNADLPRLFLAASQGTLHKEETGISNETAVTIVLASEGYPGKYEKGKEITGLDKIHNVYPYHAGTGMKDGKLTNQGGRVLALTGLGENLQEALSKTVQAAETVEWEGKYFRKDIGKDLEELVS